jgi:hypothetical protein
MSVPPKEWNLIKIIVMVKSSKRSQYGIDNIYETVNAGWDQQ